MRRADPVQAHGGVLEELASAFSKNSASVRSLRTQRRLGARAPGDVERHPQHAHDAVAAGAPRLHVDLIDAALVAQLVHGGHAREGGPVHGQRRVVEVVRAEVVAERQAHDSSAPRPRAAKPAPRE